jgi:hypothetical protein
MSSGSLETDDDMQHDEFLRYYAGKLSLHGVRRSERSQRVPQQRYALMAPSVFLRANINFKYRGIETQLAGTF